MQKTKKSFTLVEMLIVISIVGILASALIPKLREVQSRARDIARKSHLRQIGAGLTVFGSDIGDYTLLSSILRTKDLGSILISGGYLTSMPLDPNTSRQRRGVKTAGGHDPASGGTYGFSTAVRTAPKQDAFVLMAKVEIIQNANWIFDFQNAGEGQIRPGMILPVPCTLVERNEGGSALYTGDLCRAATPDADIDGDTDQRYLYIQ